MRGRPTLLRAAALAALVHTVLLAVRPDLSLAATGLPAVASHLLPWAVLLALLLAGGDALARQGRLLAVEALKVRRGFLFRIGLLATAGATLLTGLTHDALPHESGWTLASHTSGAGFFAAEVFLLVLGATALSGESTGGTLKMILPHAYLRSDWILAKALLLVAVAAVFALAASTAALAHAAVVEGLGDVTREAEPGFDDAAPKVEVFQTAATMRSHVADTLVASFGALVATGLVGLLLSSVFAGVVSSLCAAFLAYGALRYGDLVLQLPREALQRVYAWYPTQLRDLTASLGRGINERWDGALLPAGLLWAAATGTFAVLLAIVVFDRRDLQG